MPETTEPLTEAQIEVIAARKAHQYGTMVGLPVAERDALIRDWRGMKAENELAEKVLKFILPNRPLATITEIAKPALDEVDALRKQLAHVEERRERCAKAINTLLSSRDAEIREVLEGLRNRRSCWCRELLGKPAFDYTVTARGVVENHDIDCNRTQTLYAKLQPKEASDGN